MRREPRYSILERIRANLARTSSDQELPHENLEGVAFESSVKRLQSDRQSPLDRFEEELTAIGGRVRRILSNDELVKAVGEICQEENYRNVVLSRERVILESGLEEELKTRFPDLVVSTAGESNLIEQLHPADLGVTGCEFLAAETGTIVLQSSPLAPRTLSLLPRAHLVLAHEDQLLPTYAACLERLHRKQKTDPQPSCITFVTGSSRTADIEKVLVRGVHGPKDLFVLVIVG